MGTDQTTGAGASARREYDRRRARDEATVRSTWGEGRFGTIAVALSIERQSTAAWKSGAVGEAAVGRRLDAIASDHLIVLHDRRIPGSRANIDHIVVTRAGVWVIDTKRYRGKRPRLQIDGGLLRPRTEKLVVGVLRQATLVQELVEPVSVHGALCFVDADWPLVGGSFAVRGVEVCWPGKLAKRLGALDGPVDVAAVAAAIDRRFRSA